MTLTLIVLCARLAFPPTAASQATEPQQTPASSPPAPQASPIPESPTPADRPVSWKLLLPNILSDQERIWSFPARLTQGHNWVPAAAVLGVAAGLVALDPIEASFFRRASAFNGFNNTFTGNATLIGTIAAPVSMYGIGLVRKDKKMQGTALLAGEAIADSEILTAVLKDVTERVRPAAIPPHGNFSDTWFESGGSLIRGSGSFPSGHSIAAFSLATVVARRYGNHRLVPYAAYGMAAVVGFSRLTLSAHFLSDVFMGAALGYSISRFEVLRQ
jgi:membrane-associated phospholipid phosphatase